MTCRRWSPILTCKDVIGSRNGILIIQPAIDSRTYSVSPLCFFSFDKASWSLRNWIESSHTLSWPAGLLKSPARIGFAYRLKWFSMWATQIGNLVPPRKMDAGNSNLLPSTLPRATATDEYGSPLIIHIGYCTIRLQGWRERTPHPHWGDHSHMVVGPSPIIVESKSS